jgi:RimJ/RimL family protein N-acetyltransferase
LITKRVERHYRGVRIVDHPDPLGFAAQVEPLLKSDPARHTVALTVLDALGADRPAGALLLTVEQDGHAVGTAFRTPPWPLAVSALPVEHHHAVITHLLREGIDPGGFTGPRDTADPITARWTAATGQRVQHTLALRLHRLGRFRAPRECPGAFRWATEHDTTWLGDWWGRFEAEANGGGAPGFDGRAQVRRAFATGSRAFGVWTDPAGEPVAVAAMSAPLHGMTRISVVYTPPEHRGRGYGARVTAEVTRHAWDTGLRDIVLFTDVANPVSNAIYLRMGYRPLHEAVEHRVG